MTTSTLNLFEPRGGSLMSHVCESCGEPIDEEALLPLCEDCLIGEEEEE